MNLASGRGLPLWLAGAPEQAIGAANAVSCVSVLGSDWPAMPTEPLVGEGERVAAGDAIIRDRRRPDIVVTAPVCGRVVAVTRGPRRRQAGVTIEPAPGEPRRFGRPAAPSGEAGRRLLLECGLWPSFRARPYGGVPHPASVPHAIFVSAHDTHPLAPDASVVVAPAREDFDRGLHLVASLTEGPVHVLEAAGAGLAPTGGRIRRVEISGPHPAGLVGTHLTRLVRFGADCTVWQIHYQDVIAIGHVLRTGTLDASRVVSLAGPGVARPRLVRVPAGADLDDLVAGECKAGAHIVLSGPPLAGRQSRYLRRYHWQVTVVPRPPQTASRAGWRARWARPRPAPVIPTAAVDQAIGPSIPAIPLLRALSIGDAQTAARLGCRALLEEDLALATYVTGGGEDFGARLRAVLDMLEAAE